MPQRFPWTMVYAIAFYSFVIFGLLGFSYLLLVVIILGVHHAACLVVCFKCPGNLVIYESHFCLSDGEFVVPRKRRKSPALAPAQAGGKYAGSERGL